MWRWMSVSLGALLLASACGSSEDESETTQSGGAAGGGGIAAAGGSEAAGAGGRIVMDDAAPPMLDGPYLADAGWFDCDGCACNGATHYCLEVVSFPLLPRATPPADAALCDTNSGCTPLPDACIDAPSCNCIPPKYAGACTCTDSGGGLRVECFLP